MSTQLISGNATVAATVAFDNSGKIELVNSGISAAKFNSDGELTFPTNVNALTASGNDVKITSITGSSAHPLKSLFVPVFSVTVQPAIAYNSIPAWAKKVIISIYNLSASSAGDSVPYIRLRTSTTSESAITGTVATTTASGSGTTSYAYGALANINLSSSMFGSITLTNIGANVWHIESRLCTTAGGISCQSTAIAPISSTLTGFIISRTSGAPINAACTVSIEGYE